MRREARLPRAAIPIYGITFLDILGFTILIPLLPLVAKRFGAPDVVAGALLTTTAVCATLSSPFWGALGDRFGRKPALVGSQIASFLAYLLVATAGGIPMLFVSRAVEGLGGGNLGVANAYLADVTTEEQRPRAFAYATAAFGAGFVVGPILGGALVRYGYDVPFFVAAALQAINMLSTVVLLRESPDARRPQTRRRDASRAFAILREPGIASVLARRFCYIFAFTSFFTTFSLYLADVLHLDAAYTSVLLALAGVVGAITQIVVVVPVVERFGLRRVALAAFALGIVAYAALGFANGVGTFAAVVAVWALSGSLLRPILDARMAELAPANVRGTVLGYGDALDNASLVVAPSIAAAIVGYAPRLVGALPTLALGAGALLAWNDRPMRKGKSS